MTQITPGVQGVLVTLVAVAGSTAETAARKGRDTVDTLTERFEQERARLRAVAYRMLGSASEADDALQEAWLRFDRTDTGEVENVGAWLTTVVARVCLSMLRTRRNHREE